MFTQEFLGVPFSLNLWAVVMVLWLTFFSVRYIKRVYPHSSSAQYVVAGVVASIGIFLSVLVHEFSHGLVANALGANVIDGGIAKFGLGAYVMYEADINPYMEFLISLAGPLSNMILGLIFMVPVYLLQETLFENTVQFVSASNISLAKFNMIPFPLLT